MENALQYCLGCMELSHGAAVCPRCGYVAGAGVDSLLHLAPGTVLKQRYLVGRVLGDGGFGITYLGRDLVLDSKVAVKEYFPSGMAVRMRGEPNVFPASASFKKDYQWGLERFLDEARLVRKFKDHPNIVRVEDFFPENDTAYMILEFLDGVTLEKYLDMHGGKIDCRQAVTCLLWVMDAMREVHAAGVLHRDISPDNIFLVRSGHVKVIDFGAARQAMGQKSLNLSVILKHGYAPFEQYESKGQQGPWTDVYATSATLYRAITGLMPPAAPDRFKADTLVPPSGLGIAMPAGAEAALMKGLALRVEDRYPDMLAMEKAFQGKEEAKAAPGPVPVPVPTPARLWLFMGGAALTVLFGLWFFLRPSVTPAINVFRAEPMSVTRGGTVKLSWEVAGAQSVEVEGLGLQELSGTTNVVPNESAAYTLIARPRRGQEIRRTVEVTVVSPAAARIARLDVKPEKVKAGDLALLSWEVQNATAVKIDGQSVAASGSQELRPNESKTYTLQALGPDGARQQAQVLVSVEAKSGEGGKVVPPGPEPTAELRVNSFRAQPGSIDVGQSASLSWSVSGASHVRIAPEPGAVALEGEARVTPRESSRYVLTAVDARGRGVNATAVVNVTRAPIPVPCEFPCREPVPSRYSWQVSHDHQGLKGLNPYDRDWNHCEGVLRVAGKTIRYDTRHAGDSFQATLAEIDEVKLNRIGIRGMKSFHIKLSSGRNFNFVSQESPDRIVSVIQKLIR